MPDLLKVKKKVNRLQKQIRDRTTYLQEMAAENPDKLKKKRERSLDIFRAILTNLDQEREKAKEETYNEFNSEFEKGEKGRIEGYIYFLGEEIKYIAIILSILDNKNLDKEGIDEIITTSSLLIPVSTTVIDILNRIQI